MRGASSDPTALGSRVFSIQHGDKGVELARAVDGAVAKLLRDTEKGFQDQFQRGYLVSSFSRRVDSILMWSHYGHMHTGFCIEYDFGSLPHSDVRTRMLEPIIYRKELFDATEYYKPGLFHTGSSINSLFGVYVTMMKAAAWSYEREWRLILPMGPGADDSRRLLVPPPRALYLGARMVKNDKAAIVDLARQREIPIYKMRLAERRYGLEAVSFDAV